MQQSRRFEVLDSFRGLCALSVVLYHLHVSGSFAEIAFFRGSSIFVEFFFVLSGFVLAHGYAFRDNFPFRPYFTARFFRLFPLHLFMLLTFIFLEFGKWCATQGFGLQMNNAAFTNDYSVEGIVPNMLLIHAWTPYTNPLSFNTPSWSISIEFYMYILLFLSIALRSKHRVLLWGLIPVTMFYLMITGSDLLLSPVMRGLSGFFAGVFCYVIYRKWGHAFKLSKSVASVIESILLLLVVWVVQSEIPNRSILATSLFFVVVFWFALEAGYLSRLLKHRIFLFFGKVSFSVYMTHAAVIYLLTSVFMVMQNFTGQQIIPSINGIRYFDTGYVVFNNLLVVLVLAVVLICSYLTYHVIELRGQKWGKAVLSSFKYVPAAKTPKFSGRTNQHAAAERLP